MKKILLFIGFIFVIWPAIAQKEHSIRAVGENKIEIKGLREGDTVHTSVLFKNFGNNPYTIVDIKSSCHCTVPKFKKTTLQAGEEISIPVKIDTKGMSGRTIRNITIYTDEPDNRKVAVYFILHVTQDIRIIPRFVDFQNCRIGKKEKRKINIKNNSPGKVQIIDVSSDLPGLILRFKKQYLNPGDSLFVELEFKSDHEATKYKKLHIEVDGEVRMPVYTIPIYVKVYK